jgi:methylene-tetrahydromethanopterin dehydrogenase
VKRTGMFIGGKRAIEALDMMKRAKAAMVPPFEISVFADPAGSFTTAAAMVACVKVALKEKFSTELTGKRIAIFGGTGVVGFASGVIAAIDGAHATLIGYDGPDRVRKLAEEANARFSVNIGYADGSTEEQKEELVRGADIIFAAGPAGKRLITLDQMKQAKHLRVVTDVNAVPPSGVEGVGVNDNATPIPGDQRRWHRRARGGQYQVQDRGRPVQRDDRNREADLSRFPGRLHPCPEARVLSRARC